MAMDKCCFQDTFHCFAEGKLTPILRSIMSASCQFDVSAPLRLLGWNSEEILCLKLATVFHAIICRAVCQKCPPPLTQPQAHSSINSAAFAVGLGEPLGRNGRAEINGRKVVYA